jgi:O-antigen/teichoic acid export membrane protein
MEPRQYQRRQTQDFSEETFSLESSYRRQEKIYNKKETFSLILNIIFHLIFLFLSVFYYGVFPLGGREISTYLTNIVLLNIFFFIMLWVLQNTIQRDRRVLYSCLIFITTLALFFICLFLLAADKNASASLFGGWGVILLVDVIIYCLVRFVSSE